MAVESSFVKCMHDEYSLIRELLPIARVLQDLVLEYRTDTCDLLYYESCMRDEGFGQVPLDLFLEGGWISIDGAYLEIDFYSALDVWTIPATCKIDGDLELSIRNILYRRGKGVGYLLDGIINAICCHYTNVAKLILKRILAR